MSREFLTFQKEFKKWQDRFGLNGYSVFYKYEPIDAYATILVCQEERTATVTLNSNLGKADKPFHDIKREAKHEAIHLLTARYNYLAHSRFTTPDTINDADEELVYKLEELIQ